MWSDYAVRFEVEEIFAELAGVGTWEAIEATMPAWLEKARRARREKARERYHTVRAFDPVRHRENLARNRERYTGWLASMKRDPSKERERRERAREAVRRCLARRREREQSDPQFAKVVAERKAAARDLRRRKKEEHQRRLVCDPAYAAEHAARHAAQSAARRVKERERLASDPAARESKLEAQRRYREKLAARRGDSDVGSR